MKYYSLLMLYKIVKNNFYPTYDGEFLDSIKNRKDHKSQRLDELIAEMLKISSEVIVD